MGDALIPATITELLGCEPTSSHVKGEIRRGKRTGREFKYHSGQWSLRAKEEDPGNLNAQIEEIFSRVTPDLAIWADLGREFRMDLFCGLFMRGWNEGVCLTPQSLTILASRGIELSLDVYANGNDDDDTTSEDSSASHLVKHQWAPFKMSSW